MTMNISGYKKLDHPEILKVLFHPRRQGADSRAGDALDYEIRVDEQAAIVARFHLSALAAPNIIFFHGNGEIAADYDEIGPSFNECGMSFLVTDYRGYGRSSGTPSASAMLSDAHVIFAEIRRYLQEEKRNGPLVVMGRSLGSACALELAAAYAEAIDGLIIESGFSTTVPLLQRLGVDTAALGFTEDDGFRNVRKISGFSKPTYILHARHDQIIPVASAEILQAQCAARSKEFQVVPGVDHNTIISGTGRLYFEAIKRFVSKLGGADARRATRYRPRS